MKAIEEKADYVSGFVLALFFALPVLRVTAGIGAVAYFVLTGFLLGIIAFQGAMGWTRRLRSYELWAVGALFLLLGWLLITALWTVSNNQYVDDSILIAGLLVLTASVPFIAKEKARAATLWTLCSIGVATGAYVLYGYTAVDSLRGYEVLFRDFYLNVSQSIGAAAVGLTVYTLFARERRWWQVAVIPLLFIALALSLARGALLFGLLVSVVAIFYALYRMSIDRSSIRKYLGSVLKKATGFGAIVGGGIMVITVALAVERTARRLERLISGEGASSVEERLSLWRASWESIQDAPIWGHGLGSNGIMTGASEAFYPHNFFLQVWLDGGIVAALLTAFVVGLPIIMFFTRGEKVDSVGLSFLAIYIFMLLEYSKSYNFYTARILFISYVIAICSLSRTRSKN